MVEKLRDILWRILGVSRKQILRNIDYVYLKDDKFSKVGNKTYENGAKVWRWTETPLIIGNYCSIANGVNFILDDANHSISRVTSFPLVDNLFGNQEFIIGQSKHEFLKSKNSSMKIQIGNDVWVGMGAIILPGVKIGNGATVAAGSIVTKDVEDYSTVGGVPAKLIAHKCSNEYKYKMNKIEWWNWSDKKIKNNIMDFIFLSIEEFADKHINNGTKEI
ncbi:MAG: CatB-related O-acetyltransferase [Odoribacter sp.]